MPEDGLPKFDVVSIGSTMLRLAADRGETLATASSLQVNIAGAESNALIALSQLGLRTSWASKLPVNPVGRRVVSEIRSRGVDTSSVCWTHGSERAELLFVERAVPPRPTIVHYDRQSAAIASLAVSDIDLAALLDARMYHCTGILPSLSSNCLAAALRFKEEALMRGLALSCDLNYRSKLWPPSVAVGHLADLARDVTLLFITMSEAALFGIEGSAEEVAVSARDMFHAQVVIAKQGIKGVVAYDGKCIYSQAAIPTEVVDRLGAGDAFCAGVIYGYLHSSLQHGLEYGCRMASLKLTTNGDAFVFGLKDVEDLVLEPRDIER